MQQCLTVLLLAVALVQSGCGPTASSARRREPRSEARPASETAPLAHVDAEVEFYETTCVLRAAAGAVRPDCTDGALSCTEVVRGDLADLPGDEVLVRCDDEEPEPGGRAFAVVNGDTLLWVHQLHQMCSGAGPTSHIRLVDVVPGPRRELFLQTRDCTDGTGTFFDADQLFAWHAGGMVDVAGAGLDCSYTGNTGDPDAPEPPADERYVCEGDYLDVADGAVTRIAAPVPVTGNADRDDQGRVALGPSATRVVLRWNAEAFQFEAPSRGQDERSTRRSR
jgi:hypothetical protein